MIYEVRARICVGGLLESEAVEALVARFHAHLGLDPDATVEEVHARLRDECPKHRLHESDRTRYIEAFDAFVDEVWDVNCAIGGVSEGGVDPSRCHVFVGIAIEDFEWSARIDMPAQVSRPRWLKKGDLSAGSDFSRELGVEAHKAFVHASKMYQRARLQIFGDAKTRTASLPVSKQHEIDWALVKWLVPRYGT